MNPIIRIVAEQEIRNRLRQKSFLISVGVLVAAAVAGVLALYFLEDRDQEYDIAVVDPAAADVVEAASSALESEDSGTTAEARTVDDAQEADDLVEEGEVDAALLTTDTGFELVGDSEVETELASALTVTVQSLVVEQNAQELSVDLAQLNAGTSVDTRLLDPNADESGERQGVAFMMVLLFFAVAVTFGMFIAQSVTAEKESRVVEILAAAIPLRDLLWGKILSNSALALGQIAVTLLAAVLMLVVTGLSGILGIVSSVAWWYLAFFVLGFVALSGVWAVAGSMAARQQDLNSTTTPVMILVFTPYMISTVASGTMVTVTSMVPIASAMVMPSRLATESVPLWQVLGALGLNVLAAVVLVWLAAKAYERTVMRTERVTGFRELFSRS